MPVSKGRKKRKPAAGKGTAAPGTASPGRLRRGRVKLLLVVLALAQVGKSRLERMRTESREAAARFSGGLGEVLASVQAVQVAGAEERAIAHLRLLGCARQQATLRDWLQQGAWGTLFKFADTIGVALVLLVAAVTPAR